MIEKTTENGTIKYTETALAQIIGSKTCEIPGVSSLASKNYAEGLLKKLQKEQYANGITVEGNEDKINITIAIIVNTKMNFSEVAKNVIAGVKYDVERLTSLTVENITVLIQDVVVDEN